MGDVGALALGGALGTIAVIVRQEIVLVIMGGIFVVEAISVMAQVMYFKYTKKQYGEGRRILKMAPLHHHFEKSGWTRDAGRRAFLDHHDAAVPAGPVHPEAEMSHASTSRTSHVLILGLGASGLAMARWCARRGAQVTVADTREDAAATASAARAAAAGALRRRAVQRRAGCAGHAGRVPQPGPVAGASCDRAGSGPRARRAHGRRVEPFCRRAGGPARARALCARRARRHRHQRQDHGDGADRSTGRARGQDGGRGRQHRPDLAGHAGARRSMPAHCRRCG